MVFSLIRLVIHSSSPPPATAISSLAQQPNAGHVRLIYEVYKSGRIRTDKIGVVAGDDIGGTDISCHFMARQYTRPTRQSYRNDHRHVGVMPATPSINTPDWCAEQVRTRLPCDLTLFCSADTDFVGACTPALNHTQ